LNDQPFLADGHPMFAAVPLVESSMVEDQCIGPMLPRCRKGNRVRYMAPGSRARSAVSPVQRSMTASPGLPDLASGAPQGAGMRPDCASRQGPRQSARGAGPGWTKTGFTP